MLYLLFLLFRFDVVKIDFVQFPIRIGHHDYLDIIYDGVTGDIIGFKRRRPRKEGEAKQIPKYQYALPDDVIVEQYLLLTEEEKKQRMFASRKKGYTE